MVRENFSSGWSLVGYLGIITTFDNTIFKMEKFNELKELINSAETDATAFYEKGNKAAGTRLRNAMQNAKVLASDIRKEVTEMKNKEK